MSDTQINIVPNLKLSWYKFFYQLNKLFKQLDRQFSGGLKSIKADYLVQKLGRGAVIVCEHLSFFRHKININKSSTSTICLKV